MKHWRKVYISTVNHSEWNGSIELFHARLSKKYVRLRIRKIEIRFDKSQNQLWHKIGDKICVKESQIENKIENKFSGPSEMK